MLGSKIDNLIGVFSPRWALERITARATMAQIQAFAGSSNGGYDAGKVNRLTKNRMGSQVKENAIPIGEIAYLRWQSWALYRNNPWARKIVRSIQSKVVGRGLKPASQARKADGSPHTAFRDKATEIWESLHRSFDYRGAPGKGGLAFVEMQRLALLSVILSGEVLGRYRPLSPLEAKERGALLPLSLQLIDADRLDATSQEYQSLGKNGLYRGIEIDEDGRRVAYHLLTYPIGYVSPLASESKRIEAKEILHTFVEEDVDQLRGVPWFSSALLQIRDTGDYQYNELKASAMAACVTLLIKRPTGATGAFGLRQSSDADTADDNGNPASAMQPGMIVNTGKDGGLEGFNPARPGANAEAFIQHMLRGTAVALPGVKSSTVTGDYRNSSFSSERSADNDCWPETEALQDWFSDHFMQPLFEKVITEAVIAGLFDGIVSAEEFAARKENFLCATWQGPISRSINPKDDADAAAARVKGGQSSMQIECAALNRNWVDVLNDTAELYEKAKELKLPEEVVNNILGIDSKDVIQPEGSAPPKKPADRSEPPELPDEMDDEDEIPTPGLQVAKGVGHAEPKSVAA